MGATIRDLDLFVTVVFSQSLKDYKIAKLQDYKIGSGCEIPDS